MKPYHLLCEYLESPLGLDTPNPRFSWKLYSEQRDQKQTAYRIIVSGSKEFLNAGVGDKWDSGAVQCCRSAHIEYSGRSLGSGERCFWNVSVRNARGDWRSSDEAACFEMGLLNEEDWKGGWIKADDHISSPLFRRSFHLDKDVKRGRAYICGLGYYEFHLNGEKIGTPVLVPNWTNYDDRNIQGLLYPFEDRTSKRVHYLTYDITGYLKRGGNSIGIMLGNGWYNQRERTVEGNMWFGSPKLLFHMDIELEDGSHVVIKSDEAWKYSEGPIRFNNLFIGEIYDARLEQKGWDTAEFDDSCWRQARKAAKPSGKLQAQTSPPDKVIRTIKPQKMISPEPGMFIYDMGENFSGWIRLKVHGARGTKVILRFAEEIGADNRLDFTSAGGAGQIQSDIYYLKGIGEEVYQPRFTWHGFRYVEITGISLHDLESVEGAVVHAAVERTGFFQCSNPLFNKIYEIYIRTQLSNLHGGVPSDCPHRERLGYTGDGHITAEAAILTFDMAQFYAKWIQDIFDAQNKSTGFVPHTAPFNGGGGGPAWGCACIILPWLLYLYYGDTKILEEHYPEMKLWMAYLGAKTDGDRIIVKEEDGSWCLGDWCVPGSAEAIRLPPEFVNTFFYAYVSKIMSRIAAVLNLYADSMLYSELLKSIGSDFHKKFWNEKDGCYSIGCQGADALPLFLEMVPKDKEDAVLGHLVKNILQDNKGHLDTGIFGTPLLLYVLADYGCHDTAFLIMDQKTFPSYGYMIEKGATTLWENWDGRESHNHPMFGSVIAWFVKKLAGISADPESPGFANIIIRPWPTDGLSSAAYITETIRGTVRVQWEKNADRFSMDLEIPANCTAAVYLPVSAEIGNTVLEDCRPLIKDGAFLSGIPGIHSAALEKGYAVLDIGSGKYHFSVL